jgi:hypothetical protein
VNRASPKWQKCSRNSEICNNLDGVCHNNRRLGSDHSTPACLDHPTAFIHARLSLLLLQLTTTLMSTAASQPQESVKRQRSHNLCHSPPNHKRPRAASTATLLDDTCADMGFDPALHMLVKRDANYYFEDGSCIFLVEDTLFNVRRSCLNSSPCTQHASWCRSTGRS